MPADFSELSSIASTLEQLTRRVAEMGEAAQRAKEEQTSVELFAVERELTAASKRVARMVARQR
jgi:hypothetical protein